MFERVRRLFRSDPDDGYVRGVAVELLRQGMSPAELDEIQSAPALEQSSRILSLLREQNLSASDAAQAIWLATNLFRKTSHMAQARGWPLRQETSTGQDLAPKEAYFLELLSEAARSVQFKTLGTDHAAD